MKFRKFAKMFFETRVRTLGSHQFLKNFKIFDFSKFSIFQNINKIKLHSNFFSKIFIKNLVFQNFLHSQIFQILKFCKS